MQKDLLVSLYTLTGEFYLMLPFCAYPVHRALHGLLILHLGMVTLWETRDS